MDTTLWYQGMETLSTLLAIFIRKEPLKGSFDDFFVISMNKLLN